MKAKIHASTHRRTRSDEPLPHELGLHLFALVKRNLLARRTVRPPQPRASQLTFAF
jgi:hypothetical protein